MDLIRVCQALIAEVMIFGGNIESLIDFFSFTVWIFYGMSMLALLVLRKSKPDIARPYKVSTVSHCFIFKPNRNDLVFGLPKDFATV